MLLTTSQSETSEFYGQLMQVAREHGFRTHVSSRLPSPRERARDHLKARATGGTLRDTIVLDAHESITSRYVGCIDADTVTDVSLDYLVGAVEQADLDIASVVLTAANTDTLLARLQGHEYRLAMRIRRLMPWLLPIRWYYLLRPSWPLLCAVVLYLAALVLANWKDRDWALLVYPFYSLLYTLFLVPVGIVAYAEMAVKFKNVGVITASRARHRATQQGQDRLKARAVASAYEYDTAQP